MIDRKAFCPYCGEVRDISCQWEAWNEAEFVCRETGKIWHVHYWGEGGATIVHVGTLHDCKSRE